MYCNKCGGIIEKDAAFCHNCGSKIAKTNEGAHNNMANILKTKEDLPEINWKIDGIEQKMEVPTRKHTARLPWDEEEVFPESEVFPEPKEKSEKAQDDGEILPIKPDLNIGGSHSLSIDLNVETQKTANEELEKALFDDMSQNSEKNQDILKFFTYSKEIEDAQKTLDKEYSEIYGQQPRLNEGIPNIELLEKQSAKVDEDTSKRTIKVKSKEKSILEDKDSEASNLLQMGSTSSDIEADSSPKKDEESGEDRPRSIREEIEGFHSIFANLDDEEDDDEEETVKKPSSGAGKKIVSVILGVLVVLVIIQIIMIIASEFFPNTLLAEMVRTFENYIRNLLSGD